ncbi:MAG: TIGR03943 family protein [Chthoniobacterales bacterium]
MKSLIHRLLSVVVLLVWGAVMLVMFFSGRIDSYLAPNFRIYAAVAGSVMIGMAIALALLPRRDRAEDLSGCENSLARSMPGHVFAAVVLIAPLLVAFTYSPSQFGATMVRNRGFADVVVDLPGRALSVPEPPLPGEDPPPEGEEPTMEITDYMARNEDGQIIAELIDLLYAAQEPTMLPDFLDQDVELVGQFLPPAEGESGDGKLVRMMMSCCAADARPVAVTLETDVPIEVTEMTWVKVIGKATFPVIEGRHTPIVQPFSVEQTDPPENLFFY